MAKIFTWTGFEGNEEKNGRIEASSIEEAQSLLAKQNIMVTEVTEDETVNNSSNNEGSDDETLLNYRAKKIKNKDKVVFTKKLATMVKSGLPIMKTLKMLEEQSENKNMRSVAHIIRKDVEGGATLSEAFEQHPEVFDQVYTNLLKAGESSGKLTTFLEKLVVSLEKTEKIHRKVKGALMYPIILVCVAVGVIMVMLIKVVPVFQNMFKSMGHDLPGPTQLIVDISGFIRDPAKGGLLVLSIVIFFIIFKKLKKNNVKFKKWFDKNILKVPLVSEIIVMSTLSKIAMISANLSAAGVSVVESLNIVAKTISNTTFLEAFEAVKKGVTEGKNLSTLYSEHEVFPQTFHQMVQVGEETGRLDEMLESIALYYEEEFDVTVDRLTELLEPLMIVFMGITVGFIIIAMYMPIFQIGNVVSSG